MPTTRNAAKQSKIDDFPTKDKTEDGLSKPKDQDLEHPNKQSNQKPKKTTHKSLKRDEAPETKLIAPPAKRGKKSNPKSNSQQHFSSNSIKDLESPIIINRSPVLQLWGACVATFLNSDLSWKTCLSIGNAISSLCAVSKGRSVGMIAPPDEAKAEENQEKRETAQKKADSVEVMGFQLYLKEQAVLLSGKPRTLNEDNLIKKFGGEEQYHRTKSTMSVALATWEEEKDELNKKAFHMYEKFRPNVAPGQQGWGRKGELNLHDISSIVNR